MNLIEQNDCDQIVQALEVFIYNHIILFINKIRNIILYKKIGIS